MMAPHEWDETATTMPPLQRHNNIAIFTGLWSQAVQRAVHRVPVSLRAQQCWHVQIQEDK